MAAAGALVVGGQLLPGGRTRNKPETIAADGVGEHSLIWEWGTVSLGSASCLLPSACFSLGLSRTRDLKPPAKRDTAGAQLQELSVGGGKDHVPFLRGGTSLPLKVFLDVPKREAARPARPGAEGLHAAAS